MKSTFKSFYLFIKRQVLKVSSFKFWDLITYFLFAFYCFGVPSFNERRPHYLILYLVFFLLCISFSFSYVKRRKIIFYRESLYFLLFCTSAIPGTILFSKQYSNLLSLFLMGVSFFVFYIMFLTLDKQKLLLSILFGFFAFSLYFLIYYHKQFLSISFTNERLGSFFGNQNVMSFYFLFGAIISLHFAFFSRMKLSYLFFFALALFALLGYSTGSRTFLIEFLITFFIAFFYRFRKKKIVVLIGGIVIILVFVSIFTLPIFSTISKKLIKQFGVFFGISVDNKVDYSTIFRDIYMKYGFHLGLHHLFFGLGSFGFSALSAVGTYTHSNFAEILCNFGIVGFLLYYYLFFLLAKHSLNNKKDFFIIISFLICNILTGFMSVNYFQKYQSILLPSIMAIAYLGDGKIHKRIHVDSYMELFV